MTKERQDITYDDTVDNVARLLHASVTEDIFIASRASLDMRVACLLRELSFRAEADDVARRVYAAYFDTALKLIVEQSSFANLITQSRNFIEIDRLIWIKDFFDRNQSYLTTETVTNAVLFSDVLLGCARRTSQHVDRWCGIKILATFTNFDADAYLAENRDVADSIELGGFKDALDHFQQCGHAERRNLRCFPPI